MLIGIDRVIIPIDEDEREGLSRRLVDAGLVYTGDTGLSASSDGRCPLRARGRRFHRARLGARAGHVAVPESVRRHAARRGARIHVERLRRRPAALRW